MIIVALVSGGIDSVVMCKLIEKQGEKVAPLHIDYGHLAAAKEWATCQQLFKECNLPEPKKADLNGYGKLLPSGLTDPTKDIHKDAFLPCRNMLFLLVGGAYAYSIGAKGVAIGLLTEKSHIFPDQTEEFIVNTNIALNSTLGKDLIVYAPLMQFSKSEVIKLARSFSIPLNKTYSCHSGKDKYCGKCIACRMIIDSGEEASFAQFKEGQ